MPVVESESVELRIRKREDVDALAQALKGFEVKSCCLLDREMRCSDALLFFRLADFRYKPSFLLEYFKEKLRRYRQVFHAYGFKGRNREPFSLQAYIYPPFRMCIWDGWGYVIMYSGALEKIYQELELEPYDDETNEIRIYVPPSKWRGYLFRLIDEELKSKSKGLREVG